MPEVLSMASFEPLPPPLLHASESPASRPEAPKIAPSPQSEASGSRHDDQGAGGTVGSTGGNLGSGGTVGSTGGNVGSTEGSRVSVIGENSPAIPPA
jgi:hypothetical protein